MDKFILNDDMLTGLAELDDQHRKLLSWGNALYSDKSENAVKKVENTLHNLSRYVSYHFRAEENAMVLHDYELLDKHKLQHERLMLEVGKLVIRSKNEGVTKGLLVELQYQFIDWFTHHIKEWDQPFAKYLNILETTPSFTLKEEGQKIDWNELDLP